jgi:hypothetical protein
MNARLIASAILLVVALIRSSAAELLFQFTTNDVPVYDFSQTWETNENGSHEVFTIDLSPQGKISGPFTATYNDAMGTLDMSGQLGGKLIMSGSTLKLILTGRGTFSGTIAGRSVTGTERLRANFRMEEGAESVVGRMSVVACVRGYGCQSQSQTMRMPFSGMEMEEDGSWSLALNLNTEGTSVTGTATATLANGRTVPFVVTGKQSSSGLSTLKLAGTDTGAGVILLARLNGEQQLTGIKGKLFGQKISWVAP